MGNFGWYRKSLHSHTMPNTESGMLNNANLQCYISHLFCICTYLSLVIRPLSDQFIYPPLLVMWIPVAQSISTLVCWLQIHVRSTSRYWYIPLQNTFQKATSSIPDIFHFSYYHLKIISANSFWVLFI